MQSNGLHVETILCSAADRATQTASAVAKALSPLPQLTVSKQLYLATPSILLAQLNTIAADIQSVMVVAHNPGLEQLLYQLTHEKHAMRPASLAHINLSRPWNLLQEGSGELLTLRHP